MPDPAVSVVMPAYNHERFIARTIESVLGQSWSDLELIIIDDGSTDATADVVRSFSDPRIRYTFQPNQDAYNALNNGIEKARGEFISIINSDDIYLPGRLQRLVECCEQGADFVFSDVEPIDDQGSSLLDRTHPWNQWHQENRRFYMEEMDLYRGFLHGNFMVTTSNIFMRRSLSSRVGGFAPIRYLHDYDYVFRLLIEAEPRTRYLHDELLLQYRIHGGNTLSEAAVTGREQDREIIRKYLLKRLPADSRIYAVAGIDRLLALEHELIAARRQLNQAQPRPAPPAPSLARRALRRLTRVVRHDV